MKRNVTLLCLWAGLGPLAGLVQAWDYPGHRAVNELALASLPADFPGFVREPAARERIAYLAGEADRWRNVTDTKTGRGLELGHCNGPDHYLDLEDLAEYDLTATQVSPFRYVFAAQIAAARREHPERFPVIDPAKNADHSRELSGFSPWTINEYFQKLQSDFSVLAAFEKHGGTPEEIANARQDIVYVMGVMGHFVGDAGQPLHTTMHHHGWVTNSVTGNPHHYSNDFKFHAWIDGGFFDHTGGVDPQKLAAQIKPAETLADAGSADGIFRDAMDFIIQQNGLVEKLYQLEQAGKLAAPPADAQAGREFLEGQLVKSGQLLGNIWLTAYRTAPEDTYLSHQLELRQAAATKATEQKP